MENITPETMARMLEASASGKSTRTSYDLGLFIADNNIFDTVAKARELLKNQKTYNAGTSTYATKGKPQPILEGQEFDYFNLAANKSDFI